MPVVPEASIGTISVISIQLGTDGCPILVRSAEDKNELLNRHQWMSRIDRGIGVGPSVLEESTLTRPFVSGRPLDQVAGANAQRAVGDLVEFIATMHESGCTHGGLHPGKVIVGTKATYVLDARTNSAKGTVSEHEADIAALGALIQSFCPKGSAVRTAWEDLSGGPAPSASILARRVQAASLVPLAPPIASRWPRQLAMIAVLGLTAAVLLVGSRFNTGSPNSEFLLVAETSDTAKPEPTKAEITETPTSTSEPEPASAIWTEESCDAPDCPEAAWVCDLDPCLPPDRSWADGVLTYMGDQYSLGNPGDEVFWGRWYCDLEATPAVLTPAGSLYLFADMQLPAVRTDIGPVEALEVAEGANCDSLVATRFDGSTTEFPENS